jgi:hypothetical protein
MMRKGLVVLAATALAVSQVSPLAEEKSLDDVGKELANPATSLGSLGFNLDYISYKGDLPDAGNQDSWALSFQPILPYNIGDGTNLYFRPLVPVVYERPIPAATGGFEASDTELGDISFDLAVGKNFPSGLVLFGGLAGTLDTATDDAVGRGQTPLGPEFAIAEVTDAGLVGVLVNHQWDVAGDDDFDTSLTGGNTFTPSGWVAAG